ncbi:MAG: ERF family protein [Bacteroidales bacterium]|nr:ERF family protein [Lentimicrobiaceae bacterium]MDD5695888.1 ERF family protein [Bacteroidales bacterium]
MRTSESITAISKALIEFQGRMVKVTKDAMNPHFKNRYASLSQIIESVQKPLNECGLAVMQLPAGDHELETILIHTSGEFIAETYRMTPQRDDPQGLGSAITYQRRYALGAILCLNIDEDDDATRASTPEPLLQPDRNRYYDDGREWISEAQFNKTVERFRNGETDIIDRAIATFRMKRVWKEELLSLKRNGGDNG